VGAMLDSMRELANRHDSAEISVGSARLNLTGSDWSGPQGSETLTISAKVMSSGLADGLEILTEALGISKYALPDWITKAKEIELRHFGARLEKTPTGPKVIEADFGLGALCDWVIVENLLTVSEVTTGFCVKSSTGR
jgi:hypothetical protein